MDISQMIVDILRRGKENRAVNKGGLTVGTPEYRRQMRGTALVPRATEPRHAGESYDDIVTRAERGR